MGQGIYNYMSTRNNAFSNRSQKGTLVVANVGWANGAFPYWEHHEELADYDWSEFFNNEDWSEFDWSDWSDWSDWEDWSARQNQAKKTERNVENLLRLLQKNK